MKQSEMTKQLIAESGHGVPICHGRDLKLSQRIDALQEQADAQGLILGTLLAHPAPASGSVASATSVASEVERELRQLSRDLGHLGDDQIRDRVLTLADDRLAPPAKASEPHEPMTALASHPSWPCSCGRKGCTYDSYHGNVSHLPEDHPARLPVPVPDAGKMAEAELRKRAEEVAEQMIRPCGNKDVQFFKPFSDMIVSQLTGSDRESHERIRVAWTDALLAFARSATGSKVNLPERKKTLRALQVGSSFNDGWNDCLAEFARLNPPAAGEAR